MKAPGTVAFLLLGCLAAAGSAAAGVGAGEMRADELGAAALVPGTAVRVTGKYRELVDREMRLFDCQVAFRIEQPDLFKKALGFQAQHDNVTLSGAVLERDGVLLVLLDDLAAAPSDLERFTARAEALLGKEGGSEPILALGKEILMTSGRFRDLTLGPLARRVLGEGIRRMEGKAPSHAVDEHLRAVREAHRLLGDKEWTLEALVALGKKCPGHAAVAAFLGELNCRSYRGKWVTHEEMKKLEGLVEHGGRWMSAREKHLVDSLEGLGRRNLADVILRKRTDREYALLAEKGTIEEGMKPEEVSLAIGFPDRVERRFLQQKELDQWSYGNQYCYFFGGLLVLKP